VRCSRIYPSIASSAMRMTDPSVSIHSTLRPPLRRSLLSPAFSRPESTGCCTPPVLRRMQRFNPVASGMPCPALPPAWLSNSRYSNSLSLWHGPCLLSEAQHENNARITSALP
jgi:hypothetical protein